jgi:hypothetical protein
MPYAGLFRNHDVSSTHGVRVDDARLARGPLSGVHPDRNVASLRNGGARRGLTERGFPNAGRLVHVSNAC